MALLSAQVTLPMLSGLPTDVAVNTWAFDGPVGAPTEAQFDAIEAALGGFYLAIGPYLSPVLTGAIDLKIYNTADPEPRAPLRSGTAPVTMTVGANAVPEEVAVCFSFRGLLVSGEPPARRRGRVFLGPLADTAIEAAPNERVRPAVALSLELIDAYGGLRADLTGAGLVHSVWSRADGGGTEVVYAYVDNALDTQRRRGVQPTARDVIYPTP